MKTKIRQRGNRDNGQQLLPRKLDLPFDLNRGESPDSYPTLIRYLQATGRVRHLTYAQQLKARHLYIRGIGLPEIKAKTKLDIATIERLAVLNGWQEERDKRLFSMFQNVNRLGRRLSPNVDERHDRIAGSIESVVEKILHSIQEGEESVSAAEVKRLTDTLKATVEIRRTIRGQKGSKNETVHRHSHEHALQLPDEVETVKLANALQTAISGSPVRQLEPSKKVEVHISDGIGSDREFE